MENNRINSKFQKAQGGNWGGPKKHQKHLRVDKVSSDRPDVPKVKGSKKYKPKKVRKPYHVCPFCDNELPEVVSQEQAQVFRKVYGRCVGYGFRGRGMFGGLRAKKCLKCGAREVTDACPCCKRSTWFDKKTQIYKHEGRWTFCGFTGKKKVITG